jgi:hypothetical protein
MKEISETITLSKERRCSRQQASLLSGITVNPGFVTQEWWRFSGKEVFSFQAAILQATFSDSFGGGIR